jgi:hypothetical protein
MSLMFVQPAPNIYHTYHQSLLDFLGSHPPQTQTIHMPVGTIGLKEMAAGAPKEVHEVS